MANTWLGKLPKKDANKIVETVNEVLQRAMEDANCAEEQKDKFRVHVSGQTDNFVQYAEQYLRTLPEKDEWARQTLDFFEATVPADFLIPKSPRT